MDTARNFDWIDTFLFWDFVLVTFLLFVDWYIGTERRARMRDMVGDWWLYLGQITYSDLVIEDAKYVRAQLVRWFSNGWFTRSRIIRSFIASILITLFGMYFLSLIEYGNLYTKDNLDAKIGLIYLFIIYLFIPMFIPNALFDWVSISVTISLLDIMSKLKGNNYLIIIYVVFISADFILAVFLSIPALIGFLFIWAVVFDGLGYPITLAMFIDAPVGVYRFYFAMLFLTGVPIVILITSTLPTLLHIFYMVLLVMCKTGRSVLRGPVSTILLRFHESKRGVLTLLAITVGTVAKLIQEAAKYLSF